MPNSFFQFKQFRVEQGKSSMKVCTDSCLFGAWIADKLIHKIIEPDHILEIGSGTGLLSLMVAQKSKVPIDAVEIDKNSFLQANENFLASPWRDRLHNYHADIKDWKGNHAYDLIISNPPFYENDLPSVEQRKNISKHHDSLTFKDLFQAIQKNLSPEGQFALLLPYHRIAYCKTLAAENNFYVSEELRVRQTDRHSFFRAILLLSRQDGNSRVTELTIRGENGDYTPPCRVLVEDYYLSGPDLTEELQKGFANK